MNNNAWINDHSIVLILQITCAYSKNIKTTSNAIISSALHYISLNNRRFFCERVRGTKGAPHQLRSVAAADSLARTLFPSKCAARVAREWSHLGRRMRRVSIGVRGTRQSPVTQPIAQSAGRGEERGGQKCHVLLPALVASRAAPGTAQSQPFFTDEMPTVQSS